MSSSDSVLRPPAAPASYACPWTPDLGDGTFRNPVLFADYSDPDVIRVGNDFYLTASSFNCAPGLPILHSRDLVNWTIIGHAIANVPHPRYSQVQHGCGVWAPALRFHAGKFWIFFPMPDEGIYVTTADHPSGKWSRPHLLQAGKGLIDPCPLWDDDGKAYLVHAFAFSRAAKKDKLRICPMAPDGSRLLGEGRIVFDDPQRHPTLEGPKFYRRNGWYYLLAPAGGVATGWQTALRARNIYGPYEDKVILEQGSTPINGPHQGALVDLPNGQWWFLHFQDAGPYGRVVHLEPVVWKDGWPLIGLDQDRNGIGEPVSVHAKPEVDGCDSVTVPQTSDEFNSLKLGLQWQWPANPEPRWYSLSARAGWLRLFAMAQPVEVVSLWSAPSLLLQKLPAPEFTATTRLDFRGLAAGERAGLVLTGADYSYLAVEKAASGWRLLKASCMKADELGREVSEAEAACSGDSVVLRVSVSEGALCHFSYSDDGKTFVPLGKTFAARAGKWIGAKVGLFCLGSRNASQTGHADFDWLRIQ